MDDERDDERLGRPPSVDAVARSLHDTGLPHPLLVDVAREVIADVEPGKVREHARARADDLARLLLQPVVNATGVLLHTNLGRAPLEVVAPASATNLELALATGRRGNRHDGVGHLLARLCGAEAAIVVNNGAAAVLLALAALASGRQVAVSRGESVEIGGGFRIPDVLQQSGAVLVDVGTTNRTRLDDYRRAVVAEGADVACILRVHPSNFRVRGFTEAPSVGQVAELGVPVVVDLGSGLVDARCPWLPGSPPGWLAGEPGARQTLAAGASLVTFSGDKLLGGPQAGILAGRAELVERCARHPLFRALRPGGLVLGALQAVALSYLHGTAAELPFWRQAAAPVETLRARAERIVADVVDVVDHGSWPPTIVDTEAVPGAGSVPGLVIPSIAVAVDGDHIDSLRRHEPPVIARVAAGRTLCDLRAVEPAQDNELVRALVAIGP